MVCMKLKVLDSDSPYSARMPAPASVGSSLVVEVHHNPVDCNLPGLVFGIADCASMEADPVRAEVENYTKDQTYCEGRGRLDNVERTHRLDGQVQADLGQAEGSLDVVVPSLWFALRLGRRGNAAVRYACS